MIAIITTIFWGKRKSIQEDNNDEPELVTETLTELNLEEKQQSEYDDAIKYIEENNIIKAMEIFSELGDYNDSESKLASLYERYAGYYKNADGSLNFHFQKLSGKNITIEIIYKANGKQLKIVESGMINVNKLDLKFNDSENNQGQIYLELKDDNISISIKTDNIVSNLNIGNKDAEFFLDEKSDKEFAEEINKELLVSWISNKTTLSQMMQAGRTLTFVEPLYKSEDSSTYNIENTDIYVAIFNFDISKEAGENFYSSDNNRETDPRIFGVMAPASLVIPEKIGQRDTAFIEGDIIYISNGVLSQNYRALDFGMKIFGAGSGENVINGNTPICFTSKKIVGEELFEYYKSVYCD